MTIRRRLSPLLLASHVGLVLLFAVIFLGTGVGTIRAAVVAQARSEAERAVGEARRRLIEWARELKVAADLLVEQPTLAFYLQRDQLTKARALVEDFHGTSDIGYVRVTIADRTIAEVGQAPPRHAGGLAFDAGGQAWRVVQRGIPDVPGGAIVVAERVGSRLAAPELVAVRLRPLQAGGIDSGDALRKALHDVSTSGEPVTLERVGGHAAVRVVSLRDDAGQPSALLMATVPEKWVTQRLLEWLAGFGLSGLLTCVLAVAIAALLASRIARPFAQLARDAERLGSGDLDTPVAPPPTFLAEPLALATSLEEMRTQVATLTATERSQREELDAVLDGVDEGIVGVDANGEIHYANAQFLSLVGLARDDVLAKPVEAILVPMRTARSAHAGDVLLPLERYTPAAAVRPLIVRRLAASGDREVLVVREENAIEAARAMRDRILANLSHEFQTPLSAQIASIELLRDHLRNGSDTVAARLADAQYRGTMRLSQLVDNLLESVRIESGEMRLRRQPVDLAAVVAEAIDLVQPLLDQREQRIVSHLAPGPLLTGDPPRLSTVMVNLLANANKFAPDQSTIRIDMDWEADRVTVWVEDEGPGLPADYPHRDLFAPFRRSPREEPSQRGTGLGLAIVHAVVAAHGGQVRVAPPVARRGARIGIELPLGEMA